MNLSAERFFDRFFRPWWPEFGDDLTGAYPVDIREEDNKIIVDAELPGFNRDEIEVSIAHGVLHHSG